MNPGPISWGLYGLDTYRPPEGTPTRRPVRSWLLFPSSPGPVYKYSALAIRGIEEIIGLAEV